MLFSIYGAGWAIGNLCIVLLNLRALRLADTLDLNPLERYVTRIELVAWSIVGSFGLVSIALAWLLPDDHLELTAWCYALLGVVMPTFSAVSRRRAARFH